MLILIAHTQYGDYTMEEKLSNQVRPLYMEAPLTLHRAIVTNVGSGEINKKFTHWIELNETIFHPKGGGQPSDQGTIEGIRVDQVHKDLYDKDNRDKFAIYHCFAGEQAPPFKVGDEVELRIDPSVRHCHARLHTAGHIIAEAMNSCYPELVAYQGNHYPDSSYVKFKMQSPFPNENKEEIKTVVEEKFNAWIDQDHPIEEVLEPSGLRQVKVYQEWTPCGGTHVKNLKDLGGMSITEISINKKESTVTVKYVVKA